MHWPTHSPRGRYDWGTCLERGYVEPFRDVIHKTPEVVDAPVDGGGRTMLMEVLAYAGGQPWLEIVTLLTGAGADVNRRDSSGRPVWDFAPTSGDAAVEIWRVLLRAGLDIDARGCKQETPLLRVCSAYSREESICAIVQLLLDAGAAVNVADIYDDTPLRAAAGVGNADVVRLLLKAGAIPTGLGKTARTPLFEAALKGYADVVQVLLHAGADAESAALGSRLRSFPAFTSGLIDVDGVTPLIAAAEGGYFQIVRLLVDAGADVNRADAGGFTPLMGAARAGHAKMAQFLVQRGACPDAVDAGGRNALVHAVEFKHQREMAPVLRARS